MKKYLWFILALALILRVWQLDKVPVSLFGDELDFGYHAYSILQTGYSILQTGRDYTGHLLPLHLQSLAEYKTALYAYVSVPTVAIFGITPWGVRLPGALFGALGVWALYLLVTQITARKEIGLLSALLLALTPWHIHYSRSGYEQTLMLFLYMMGVYLFIRGIGGSRLLVWSALCLALTPWAYSTAKLFLPLTAVGILSIWNRSLLEIPKKSLLITAAVFCLIAGTFALSTIFGGGAERFGGISIFNSASLENELGPARVRDEQMSQQWQSKIFHNKLTNYYSHFSDNYLKAYSTEFLFINGDSSLRHSPTHTGLLYGWQLFFLLIGVIIFFDQKIDLRTRLFLAFWLLVAPIPAALTSDGGNHAGRLIFELPILIILISYGIYSIAKLIIKPLNRKLFMLLIGLLLTVSVINYQHTYWVHYPWDSERWWHAGFSDAIKSAVAEGKNYDKVIISNADEPALIFFLAWSQFPPAQFQANYPLKEVDGGKLGKLKQLDRYYFTEIGSSVGLYSLAEALPNNALYLATQKEVNVDLIHDPGRLPNDLRLVKSFAYPSGAPAFYLLTKRSPQM